MFASIQSSRKDPHSTLEKIVIKISLHNNQAPRRVATHPFIAFYNINQKTLLSVHLIQSVVLHFRTQWHVGKRRNHRQTTTRDSVLRDAILSRDAILFPLLRQIALLKVRLLTVSVMKLKRRTSLSPIRLVLPIAVAAIHLLYATTDQYQLLSSPNRAHPTRKLCY